MKTRYNSLENDMYHTRKIHSTMTAICMGIGSPNYVYVDVGLNKYHPYICHMKL